MTTKSFFRPHPSIETKVLSKSQVSKVNLVERKYTSSMRVQSTNLSKAEGKLTLPDGRLCLSNPWNINRERRSRFLLSFRTAPLPIASDTAKPIHATQREKNKREEREIAVC
jgi:hypothetical protein